MDVSMTARRPVGARSQPWARAIARWLAEAGVSPNRISVGSVAFAFAGAGFLVLSGDTGNGMRAFLLLLAAGCIPLRLACNMLDGMVAIEHGRETKSGVVFNELPDRLSDLVLLVAAGYAARDVAFAPELGWAAATAALLTAYVRALGAAADGHGDFSGPFAKQQRMWLLAGACLLSTFEVAIGPERGMVLAAALAAMAVGTAWTAARRTLRLLHRLEQP